MVPGTACRTGCHATQLLGKPGARTPRPFGANAGEVVKRPWRLHCGTIGLRQGQSRAPVRAFVSAKEKMRQRVSVLHYPAKWIERPCFLFSISGSGECIPLPESNPSIPPQDPVVAEFPRSFKLRQGGTPGIHLVSPVESLTGHTLKREFHLAQ